MANDIVTVNVFTINAPAPSQLQNAGALISQGGTTLDAGETSLLTSFADLSAIIAPNHALSTLTWTTNVATATAAAPHGLPIGQQIEITVSGVTPSGYNGTFTATVTTTTAFTYSLMSNPGGAATVPGTYVLGSVAELTAMARTFFSQAGSVGVYVLELGPADAEHGIEDLDTYITNNPLSFYIYLIPDGWVDESTYPAFINNYNSPEAKVYFLNTVTLANYTNITAQDKCAPMFINASTMPTTEFSAAAMMFRMLNNKPSSTNKVPPLCFAPLSGVTAGKWTGPNLTTFHTKNINFVKTGAEGGISKYILEWGHTPDGQPWNYWYSADWVQINLDLQISNTIINGSATSINPLYYNQQGINRLQATAASVMQQAISYGLALGQLVQTQLDADTFANNLSSGVYDGQVVVNAVPFASYSAANPLDYAQQLYTGLSAVYTPLRGFEQIVFNLNVSDFA